MKNINNILSIIIVSIIATACSKFSDRSNYPYAVRMTDAPAVYDAVLIDLQGVEITGNSGTVSLNVHRGIYNLLNFTNGIDTLIATGTLTDANVQKFCVPKPPSVFFMFFNLPVMTEHSY